MNRSKFGVWGLDLNENDFARAVAALGIAGWRFEISVPPAVYINYLATPVQDQVPLEWETQRFQQGPDLSSQLPASFYLSIWDQLITNFGEKLDPDPDETLPYSNLIRLELNPSAPLTNWDTAELFETARMLARPAVQASSVYIHNSDETNEVSWDYPVRVGFLDDEGSRQFRADIENLKFMDTPLAGTHIRIIEIKDGKSDCDILFLPHSLRESAAAIIQGTNALKADLVVVTGPVDDSDERMGALIESIRTQARVSGVCILPVPPAPVEDYDQDTRQVWFKKLIREISHNCTIDVALFRSARSRVVGAGAPIIYASRKLIQSSQISYRMDRFREEIPQLKGSIPSSEPRPVPDWEPRPPRPEPNREPRPPRPIPGPPSEEQWSPPRRDPDIDPLPPGSDPIPPLPPPETKAGRPDVNERFEMLLDDGLENLDWSRESGSAARMSEAKAKITEALRKLPPLLPRKARWIQADMWEHAGDEKPQKVTKGPGLARGSTYLIEVFIGKKREGSVAADKAFPDDWQPPGRNDHELTVIFTEPKVSPVPKVAKLKLPREGDSTACEFFISIPGDIDGIEARIIIAYKNRILQTALLTARVLDAGETARGKGIDLIIESAPRPGMQGLTARKWFDAAFVVNDDRGGASQVTRMVGDRAELIYIDGIKEKIKWFDKKISEVAEKWAKFEKLRDPKSQDLLRDCALNGVVLYETLTDTAMHGFLSSQERIQMLSAKQGSRFPLEFVYSRAAPDAGAMLCPNAEKALADGHCSTDCPAGNKESTVICPLGFWGLNRVIERHVYDVRASGDMKGAEFALQSEPLENRKKLKILQKAVVTASNRVDKVITDSIQKITGTLDTCTKHQSEKVDSWPDWAKNVQKRSPSLLVILPHTVNDLGTGQPMLEIGVDDGLLYARLQRDHVMGPESEPPVVMLLGCKTAAPDIPYESFVEKFRLRGAALVVGTGSTILGRHASPVAAAFVEALAAIEPGETSFGDVMLRVRRKMVADGILMALSLISYGDTDWEI